MCIPLSKQQQADTSLNVGRGKVATAQAGVTQYGTQMSIADRVKLLKSGAYDIVAGQRGKSFKEQDADRQGN